MLPYLSKKYTLIFVFEEYNICTYKLLYQPNYL